MISSSSSWSRRLLQYYFFIINVIIIIIIIITIIIITIIMNITIIFIYLNFAGLFNLFKWKRTTTWKYNHSENQPPTNLTGSIKHYERMWVTLQVNCKSPSKSHLSSFFYNCLKGLNINYLNVDLFDVSVMAIGAFKIKISSFKFILIKICLKLKFRHFKLFRIVSQIYFNK